MGMDNDRKRALKQKAAAFQPPMGVVSFTWKPTGETFFAATPNVPAFLNRTRLQAETNTLRNKRFSQLWAELGENAMEYAVVEDLAYEDGVDDYAKDLEALLDMCLQEHPEAQRL